MELERALALVKAAGYRVTKPKPKATTPALNAVGKPYGANYDPNYRMRYRTPALKRTQNIGAAITPERWAVMCREAQAAWDAGRRAPHSYVAPAAA
jgi:hypothetical protein